MSLAAASRPRVTFGIIVLNGEPFTRHVLRSLYPYAHQIIVVEGAAPGARNIATPDGHSRDGTLEVLRQFKADEDPDGKVVVVTAEDDGHADGFWPGEKDEQSRAYAARATGNYLWQVDIDELYRAEEMERVLALLARDPSITAMTFRQISFWGGLEYWVDGVYLRRGATYYHRLFKWGPGYTYAAHRPPTVLDESGRDLRARHWLSGPATERLGIRLYHYSLLLPKQVIEKCDYYANAEWARRSGALEWANEAWFELRRPFRVHNVYDHPSWLERYRGPHPVEIERMVADLRASGSESLRRTDDIERLLGSPAYRIGRAWLKVRERAGRAVSGFARGARRRARRGLRRLRGQPRA